MANLDSATLLTMFAADIHAITDGLKADEKACGQFTLSFLLSRDFIAESVCQDALDAGLSPGQVFETALQCCLYGPIAVGEKRLSAARTHLESACGWQELPYVPAPNGGAQEMHDIHSTRSQGGYASSDSPAAVVYAMMSQIGYGHIWRRPGLNRRLRFICALAAFAGLECSASFKKFAASARDHAITDNTIAGVLGLVGQSIGFPKVFPLL